MRAMNTGNLVFLIVAFCLALLTLQRTIPRRRWLTLVVIVLPVGFIAYRWALYKEQLQAWRIAAGVALGLNILFWVIYGRTHPPGFKGDIVVAGMEDVE